MNPLKLQTPDGNANPAADPVGDPGAASPAQMAQAHAWWAQSAAQCGIDLSDFRPAAPLADRLAWAAAAGLSVGVGYSRFSGKKQQSTADQVRTNVQHAARVRAYCPPEFLCVDEARKGSRDRRHGLERVRRLFADGRAAVLFVFKLSRLYRKMYKSVRFVEEELVEEGYRAISATQGIDTADRKVWRLLVALHGTMDEELLVAIADHVRASLVTLAERGWATGALPVGYFPREIPGAARTRRGLPRTGPAVEAGAAAMIRWHFDRVANDPDFDLAEGWRKWRADGGPVDPRSTTKRMSYPAYRRMLERVAYTGLWPFGRMRNQWSSKLDTLQQKPQSPEEVKYFGCEELRIVDDVTFCKVQERLKALGHGPRAKRAKAGPAAIEDQVVHLFACDHCDRRMHVAGAHGRAMRCPNPDCPAPAVVRRRPAGAAVLAAVDALAAADDALVDEVLAACAAPGVADGEADDAATRAPAVDRRIRDLAARVADLEELLGSGTDDDRQRRKAQIRAAGAELATLQTEKAQLRAGSARRGRAKPTRADVVGCLRGLGDLLARAAAGGLGADVTRKAVGVLTRLVGAGGVRVVARQRPGRARWSVRGRFTPDLVGLVVGDGEVAATSADGTGAGRVGQPVEVWLREPPLADLVADDVQRMYEVEGRRYPEISRTLSAKCGRAVTTGTCCLAYRRWHEVRGLPLPARRTKMGRPRKIA